MDGDCSQEIRRQLLLGRKVMTNLDSVLRNRDIILLTKVRIVKAMVFPVVMYGCGSWTIKKAECQRIDAFKLWCWRRLLKVPWTQEIKSVNLKGDQPWIFIGRTDAEVEVPVFWPSDVKRWLIGKVPDAGKDQRQEEKKASEDETAGWHHWCNERELGQTPGDSEGQGGLVCHSPWDCKESDMTGDSTTTTIIINFHFSDEETEVQWHSVIHTKVPHSLYSNPYFQPLHIEFFSLVYKTILRKVF